MGDHARVWDYLLGPYVLGDLDPDERREVEHHLRKCPACADEERKLRETHERLASAAITNVPASLKEIVLAAEPPPEEGPATGRTALPWSRYVAVAAALLVLSAGVYVAGAFLSSGVTAALTPTGLAPGAGGELRVEASETVTRADLEVWGLPRTGPNEYYELWFGREEGRVSAGTFKVDDEGWGRLTTTCPEVGGGYQRVGITLEKFPEEPRIDEAKVVLGGELRGTDG